MIIGGFADRASSGEEKIQVSKHFHLLRNWSYRPLYNVGGSMSKLSRFTLSLHVDTFART